MCVLRNDPFLDRAAQRRMEASIRRKSFGAAVDGCGRGGWNHVDDEANATTVSRTKTTERCWHCSGFGGVCGFEKCFILKQRSTLHREKEQLIPAEIFFRSVLHFKIKCNGCSDQ